VPACVDRKAHAKWIVVIARNSRCSAFDGYRPMWSPYSELYCPVCEHFWRTKAKYVSKFPGGRIQQAQDAYKREI